MREQSRCFFRKWRSGSRVQQRPRVAAAQRAAEGKIEDPDQGVVGLRNEVAAENIGGLEVGPQIGEKFVACEKSLLPMARAEPLIAPADAPPMMGKGLPLALDAV